MNYGQSYSSHFVAIVEASDKVDPANRSWNFGILSLQVFTQNLPPDRLKLSTPIWGLDDSKGSVTPNADRQTYRQQGWQGNIRHSPME